MRRLLILLTLPQEVRDFYGARLRQRFPQLQVDIVDHFSKATPFMAETEILVTFGPMLRDEVFASADKLKWIQALGTGVDGVIDQPSLRKDVIITNIRGIHGEPVSEAARWNGPYLKKAKKLLDPWGRPYQYDYPVSNGEYEVYSLGPSGKAASASARTLTTFRGS